MAGKKYEQRGGIKQYAKVNKEKPIVDFLFREIPRILDIVRRFKSNICI